MNANLHEAECEKKFANEFICGAAASFTNVIITYPISKVVFRQMLQGISVAPAIEQLKYEGILSLYRGILPPLISKTVSISFMFGAFDIFYNFYSNQPKIFHFSKNNQILFASLSAGTIEALLCTPLERVQTLLQHSELQSVYKNTFFAFQKLWNLYSIREFYRGFSSILLRNGPSTAVFFEFRSPLNNYLQNILSDVSSNKKIYEKPKNLQNNDCSSSLQPSLKLINILSNFISGAILGGTISTLFYPINVARTQMQSNVGTPFLSLIKALKNTYIERNKSFLALYYGAKFNFSRSLFSWGIINLSYEIYKRVLFVNY